MNDSLGMQMISAFKNPAVLVTQHSSDADLAYVFNARTNEYLARVERYNDPLFEESGYEIRRKTGGFKLSAWDMSSLKHLFETEVTGYPTGADMRRNYSRPVYKESSY